MRKRCVLELRKTYAKAWLQRALLHKHTDYKTFVNTLGIDVRDQRILKRLIVEFKHKHNSLQSYEDIKKTTEWSRHKPNKGQEKKDKKGAKETWQERKPKDNYFERAFTQGALPEEFIETELYECVEKKAKIKIELTPYTEKITIEGDLPPQYKERKKSINTFINFVPVFAFYNNQFSFLSEGLPEIANILPFMKKYNETFCLLEKHLKQILDPKIKLNLKSAKAFLQNNLGIKESDYDAIAKGELKPDVTQFKAAILTGENEDVSFVNQESNIKNALDVLNLIHWIIIEMTMPEYLYGTALNTTNASVREQSPVWIKKVEDRRAEYSQFYRWLVDVYQTFSYILKNEIEKDEEPTFFIEWDELEAKDDVALMNALHSATESILKALDAGLISPETAFNALKTFITIPNEYEAEHVKAIEYIREKASLEAEGTQLKGSGFSSFDNI